MLRNIILSKPDIPTVLLMTDATPRSYPAGSRFMLSCPVGCKILVSEGIGVVEDKGETLKLGAGALVSFDSKVSLTLQIRVVQRLVVYVK